MKKYLINTSCNLKKNLTRLYINLFTKDNQYIQIILRLIKKNF